MGMRTDSNPAEITSKRYLVKISAGSLVPAGLVVADPTFPTHYLWSPSHQMPLADFKAALRRINCDDPVLNRCYAAAGCP